MLKQAQGLNRVCEHYATLLTIFGLMCPGNQDWGLLERLWEGVLGWTGDEQTSLYADGPPKWAGLLEV